MANIRGISIKTVKHFIGTEGPAYQGNIYIGSKKVAFWSQDGNGGPDWFDMMNGFSKKKLVEVMRPYVTQALFVTFYLAHKDRYANGLHANAFLVNDDSFSVKLTIMIILLFLTYFWNFNGKSCFFQFFVTVKSTF